MGFAQVEPTPVLLIGSSVHRVVGSSETNRTIAVIAGIGNRDRNKLHNRNRPHFRLLTSDSSDKSELKFQRQLNRARPANLIKRAEAAALPATS